MFVQKIQYLGCFLATLVPMHALPQYEIQANPQNLKSEKISEASGLICSPTNPDFFWIINDSGGSTEVHLTHKNGSSRGSIDIDGASNRDWEDIASFTQNGVCYLLIADVGDNAATHETCTLYIIQEPKLPKNGKSISGKISVSSRIDFRYEDGPKDCESVAISDQIYLLSKRTERPILYALPLPPALSSVAKTIVTAPELSSGQHITIPFAKQATGLDFSADDRQAAVVTYLSVYLFERNTEETWREAFARKPIALPAHGLQQAESVAFSKDGDSIFVISEKLASPIIEYLRKSE